MAERSFQRLRKKRPAVQRQAAAPAVSAAPTAAPAPVPAAAAHAVSRPRGGRPLVPALRSRLERGLNRRLRDVRVHDGPAARNAAEALNARAFAHGRHIWLGAGESQSDTRLMAHEVAHTVQQGGDVRRQVIQRDGTEENTKVKKNGSTIDVEAKTLELASIKVPTVKHNKFVQPLKLRKSTSGDRGTKQVRKWNKAVREGGADAKLEDLAKDAKPAGGKDVYLKSKKSRYTLFGPMKKIRPRARRPNWNKGGREHSFDVDHIQEWQLNGPDTPNNFWLWDSSANRSSGSLIANEINTTITKFLTAAEEDLGAKKPTFEEVKTGYDVTFKKTASGLAVGGKEGTFWELSEITEGKHIELLRPMTEKEIEKVRGSDTMLSIFTSATGGQSFSVPWGPNQTDSSALPPIYQNFQLRSVTYTPGGPGSLSGVAFQGNKFAEDQDITLPIAKKAGVKYGGYIKIDGLKSKLKKVSFKGLSPVTIDTVDLEPGTGLTVRGRLTPSVPLINKAAIDIIISGKSAYLSKTFSSSEFDFPGPVKVKDSSLQVNVGGDGLKVNGNVNIEVPKLGHGNLSGSGTSQGDFSIGGKFNFESKVFDEASATVTYSKAEGLAGTGKLSVGKGKIKGVKSADAEVEVKKGLWKASGSVKPDIPGVKEGNMEVTYKEGEGLTVSGELQFSDSIPRVKSGSIKATVKQQGDSAKVSASGKAELDIPGITEAKVDASYDDGKFLVKGTVGFQKGKLTGNITAGVTNEGGGDALVPFGHGSATLVIAPWLQGKAGITLSKDGGIEVKGEISLPNAIDVFPEKKIEKELLSIGIDIPIVGVSVAGQRIGIFANITGSLKASAGFGPGKLQDTKLSVDYDAIANEVKKVSGGARFVVPAHAGLRLAVRGGIGAGIPVVSAQVGLEVGGEIGVEGEASAAVDVNWTPQAGLVLEAKADITGRPKLTVDVSGFALVEADVLVDTIELYRKNWNLAKKEIGSDMEFGLTFPITYKEGEEFNVSLSDVKFKKPKIDPMSAIKGLIAEIA